MSRGERAERALVRQLRYQEQKARTHVFGAAEEAAFIAYALGVRARIEAMEPIDDGARVLEVGSGAHGLIFFMGLENAVGVDPLADEYPRLFPRWQRRARTVRGRGEELPFADASFDLVLSDNVVDHAGDPRQIAVEMCRVLAPGGLLYFTVHHHHALYTVADKAYGAWKQLGGPGEIAAFADHTVHLTLARARALFAGLPLAVLAESDGVAEAKKAQRRFPSPWTTRPLKRAFYKNATYELIARRRAQV